MERRNAKWRITLHTKTLVLCWVVTGENCCNRLGIVILVCRSATPAVRFESNLHGLTNSPDNRPDGRGLWNCRADGLREGTDAPRHALYFKNVRGGHWTPLGLIWHGHLQIVGNCPSTILMPWQSKWADRRHFGKMSVAQDASPQYFSMGSSVMAFTYGTKSLDSQLGELGRIL